MQLGIISLDVRIKMIYNIELVLFVLTGIEVIFCAPSCKPNQKMRQDISGKQICCYTVTCELGQKFSFCKQDQGHDICTSCPEGTYHLDKIDTAIMDITFDPCVPKPTCEQPEVTLVNGECVCDRSQAYYGHDINNCFLAEVMCSSPGFELKNDGTCGPCDKEYFKSEASAEHVCRKKTICFDSQEVYSNGSKTTDRTCKSKHPSLRGIQASKHEIENNNNNTSTEFQKINCEKKISSLISRIEKLENRIKRLENYKTLTKRLRRDMKIIKRLKLINRELKMKKKANKSNGKNKKGRRKSGKQKRKSRKH